MTLTQALTCLKRHQAKMEAKGKTSDREIVRGDGPLTAADWRILEGYLRPQPEAESVDQVQAMLPADSMFARAIRCLILGAIEEAAREALRGAAELLEGEAQARINLESSRLVARAVSAAVRCQKPVEFPIRKPRWGRGGV